MKDYISICSNCGCKVKVNKAYCPTCGDFVQKMVIMDKHQKAMVAIEVASRVICLVLCVFSAVFILVFIL